jgi:hypothetical protein
MPRAVILFASAVLMLCAGLLLANAQESEASARTVTKACTDAATAKAAETRRITGIPSLPADYSQCTYAREWDVNRIAFAGIVFAGGLLTLAFGLMRAPKGAA